VSAFDPSAAGLPIVPSGGGTVIPPRLELLAGLASTDTSVGYDVLGYSGFDAATYARSGLTTTLTLEAIGFVVNGVTGTLVLYDVDAAAAAATLTWTETTGERKTASVTVPENAGYELRFSKSGGSASDYAVVSGVNLLVNWS